MTNYFSSDFKLGILGGGQLGKMLLSETQKFDIHTCVLDFSKNVPCASCCDEFFVGDVLNYEDVYAFGKRVDVLTIELEKVNVKALYKLESDGVKVYPQPEVIELIQNKGKQKDFYRKNNIATVPYKRFENLKALKSANFSHFPFIWKSACFGYDGKGVRIIRSMDDIQNLPDIECVVEEKAALKNELAVIVSRGVDGAIRTYPVVEIESNSDANQLEYLICPARVDAYTASEAKRIALDVAAAFKHVGLLAIELFKTTQDTIIVNEVSPRVHNSGHYTIEASYTNQFEQHLRAILNLPLGNTDNKISAVMLNLVGKDGYEGQVVYKNLDQIFKMEGVTLHLYGKKITKPFRKMGHVTFVNEDVNKARKMAEIIKNKVEVISLN